ncbi:unnamed protein product [Hydatigera taeniaeformis]|uniref:Ig-like domain-containing protein n=1 Tax=Hydatigena taeniaeformis TaxID=6205 RepID=A0A0R3X5Z8_HYDTA|nr:unnamed protein product [Hydatigera taeniaeformis]
MTKGSAPCADDLDPFSCPVLSGARSLRLPLSIVWLQSGTASSCSAILASKHRSYGVCEKISLY